MNKGARLVKQGGDFSCWDLCALCRELTASATRLCHYLHHYIIFYLLLHLLLASSRRTQHIPTVTAVMVDSTPLIPASRNKKQGHRVLCCCDSRKAVIMINLVALAFYIAAIVINALNGTLNNDVVSIIFMCITILFYFTVICSAIQFHR